jgi:hypothetical protein
VSKILMERNGVSGNDMHHKKMKTVVMMRMSVLLWSGTTWHEVLGTF